MRIAFSILLAGALLPTAASAQTIVSLTFDDGIKTQMLVRQSLLSHNMRGTFYVNSGTVGADSYLMSWADVNALNADGNEIGSHTIDHRRLTDLTAAERRRQICDDAAALRARGYVINTFAYPFGAGSGAANVRQALTDCGFLAARKYGDLRSEGCESFDCPFAESIPPPDPYGVRTPEWQPDEYTLGELQSFVTQAEANGGGWVPLVFHDMCNSCADSSVSVATFNALLGYLVMRVGAGNAGTPADEADVNFTVSLTDVRKAADLADYEGELSARVTIRLTDRLNGTAETAAATVTDLGLGFAVPCTPTAAANIGSACTVATSADAITPGIVVEGARSIWDLRRIAVDDGGTDGLAATDDNQPFAVQGVYVP